MEGLLKKLIEIDTTHSQNGERVVEAILEHLKDVEFEHEIHDFYGVKNLVAYTTSERVVAFNGHYDVVPAGDGWENSPFSPIVKDGFMYGRGASDMKGGLAAAVEAFKQAAAEGKRVALIVNGDEEKGGFKGAKPTLERVLKWMDISLAVITEPSSKERALDRVRKGARGVVWLEVLIEGTGGHASRPQNALNPIEGAWELVSWLREAKLGEVEEMEKTSICPTSIESKGGAMNIIPSKATLKLDIRTNAGTGVEEITDRIREFLKSKGYGGEVKTLLAEPPFYTDNKQMEEVIRSSISGVVGVEPVFHTSGGSSDARFFSARGIPAYEMGPVPRNMHAPDEHVSLEELEKVKEALLRITDRLG